MRNIMLDQLIPFVKSGDTRLDRRQFLEAVRNRIDNELVKPDKLQKFVGTLMVHTAKAVRRHGNSTVGACPGDRVFAIVATDYGPPGYNIVGPHLVAWKCTLTKDGKLDHPAFKEPLAPDDKRLFVARGSNGSIPTAAFKPDSYYRPYKGQ